MTELLAARRALGALQGDALRRFGGAQAALTEHALDPSLQLQFDDSDDAVAKALFDATGLSLAVPNRAKRAGDALALWLGPGDWLIRPGTDREVALALERVARTTGSALVDVSDLWFGVRVSGPSSVDVLAKGCALDLDARTFPPDATAVTQFARLRALIHHVDATQGFDVYVERSYAAYLWAWLVDALS